MKQSTLGSYIRFLRIQNELTQARLADMLGVTDKAVSKWERNVSYPDISLFPKLANILGVNVNDLLKECIDPKQPSRLAQIFEMSHDFRTPLHIILGCVKVAETHAENTEMVLRCLKNIRLAGEYLLQTADRVMQVAGQEPSGTLQKPAPAISVELQPCSGRQEEAGRSAEENVHPYGTSDMPQTYDFTGLQSISDAGRG